MKRYEIEVLIETLKKQLTETERMWNEKEPHAMIVGYLTGTVKSVIEHLESKVNQ